MSIKEGDLSMTRFLSMVLSVVVMSGVAMGGKDVRNVKQAPFAIDDGITRAIVPQPGRYIPGNDAGVTLNWVAVDEMANAFGPASTRVRPISYDPATGVVALIHRGAAPYGSGGQLWYNMSIDGGLSWRRVGQASSGTPDLNRYPSGTIINPANSPDTNQCMYTWVAPNLQGGNPWGYYAYGVDFPLGAGAGIGFLDNNNMGTNSAAGSIFGIAGSPWIVWASTMGGTELGGANNSRAWRTQDWVTIATFVPPTWTDATPNFVNAISFIPGMANSTGWYFGMHGLCYPDTFAYAFNGAYSKSTDNGATWSQWVRPQPDWMQATGLDTIYDLYDYVQPPGGTVSWNSDMVIDGNGRAHFFHVVVASPWTTNDPRGIVEIYQTASGWAYKWVTPTGTLNTYTGLGYPTTDPATPYLQQTNQGIRASISAAGDVMAVIWLNGPSMAPADSFPDIWFSYRTIGGESWSTPENLSQTPNFPELLLHAAPTLKQNSPNSYTMFIGRTYQSGVNTYPPDGITLSTFFVAPYTFVVTGVPDDGTFPTSFSLKQNYPNPFNPSTSIEYTLPKEEFVSLKVHNMMGQEIKTLVNEIRHAGTHEIVFDAGSLPSGVYFYKLSAGSHLSAKKMVLLR
jgi:hypothetical protein